MYQDVTLWTMIVATFTDLSWTGFTIVCSFGLIAVFWCFLPFSVFGLRGRLEALAERQREQSLLLVTEFRETSQILGTVWNMPVPKGEFDDSYPPRGESAAHPAGH